MCTAPFSSYPPGNETATSAPPDGGWGEGGWVGRGREDVERRERFDRARTVLARRFVSAQPRARTAKTSSSSSSSIHETSFVGFITRARTTDRDVELATLRSAESPVRKSSSPAETGRTRAFSPRPRLSAENPVRSKSELWRFVPTVPATACCTGGRDAKPLSYVRINTASKSDGVGPADSRDGDSRRSDGRPRRTLSSHTSPCFARDLRRRRSFRRCRAEMTDIWLSENRATAIVRGFRTR